MSDVATAGVVSVQTGERAILSNGGDAGLVRADATTLLFRAGGHENVLLLWNSTLASPCFIKSNSSNLLCENTNDLTEMQSVRQYWDLLLDLK